MCTLKIREVCSALPRQGGFSTRVKVACLVWLKLLLRVAFCLVDLVWVHPAPVWELPKSPGSSWGGEIADAWNEAVLTTREQRPCVSIKLF